MVYLATCRENCSIRSISEATGISSGYLEQLMIPLRRAGLVQAERGVQGGYRLAKADITCKEVLSASEGDFESGSLQKLHSCRCLQDPSDLVTVAERRSGFFQPGNHPGVVISFGGE